MALDKDQSVETKARLPQPAVEVRPETGSEAAFGPTFARPEKEREGLLPPPDGLPPAARAVDLMNATAEMPDVLARAQMSIALQRSVGNARMASMLQTVPEPRPRTVPEPKAPKPAQTPVEVATVLPAPPVVLPTVAKPEPKATQPAPAAPQPAPPVAQLPPSVTKPATPVAQPAPQAAEPTTSVAEPTTSITQPATSVAEPAPSVAQPAAKPPAEAAPATSPAPAAAPEGKKAAPGKGAASEEPAPAPDASAAKAGATAAKAEAAAPERGGKGAPGKGSAGKAGAAVEGGEEGGEEGMGGGGKGAEVKLRMPEPPADLTPATKQRIGKVKAAAGQATAAHTDLPPAQEATESARDAVTEPKEEADAHAEENLVNALGARPKPSPKIEELCTKIYKVIKEKRPADEDELVEAKPEEMAQGAGDVMKGNVEGDVKSVDQNYEQLDARPAGAPAQGEQLVSPPEGASAPPVNATRATPDAVPAENVSLDADVEDNKARMAEAGMESEPAKLAESGPVAEARAAEGELEETAKADPAKVLAEQKSSLAKASSDMASLQQKALAALANSRRTTVSGTTGQQKKMVGSEEQMRAAASKQAQATFNQAQTDVNEQLRELPQKAMAKWDKGVAVASEVFKQSLQKVQDWIDERHSGVGGTLLSIGDYFTGLPGWVTEEYDRAEQKFGDDVCSLAREISTEVNGIIMACEAIIANARAEIARVFSQLPQSLQAWAAGEQAKLGTQLDTLNKKAHDTRDNFDKELVNRAGQAVHDVRVQVQELRQKAKGLVGRIADAINRFLDDPAKFIIEALLDLLSIPRAAFWAVVAKIKKVIGDIADDPEKFANNLMSAVGKGFDQFFEHIGDHLINGFIDWLTGGLSAAGVELPKDFSVKSIVTFFLQLMGITWPRIRKLLAKHIGEENVALLEKVYSLVANLVTLGPEGIFEMIKEKLNPQEILNQVINAAVDYMIKAVIKAVSARILLLFNPVGAILQAIEAIYKVLKWIFTNAARIFRLIETIVNGIADILAGNIGAMANAVEKALAGLIPPVIDFLADYLGFGDLPDKVRDTILDLQEWVEGILDQVIGWLVEKGKALLAAIGIGGKDEDKEKGKPVEGQIGKSVTWTAAGESHKLWIVKEGAGASVMMASTPKPVSEQLDEYQQIADGLPEKREEATGLIAQARQILTSVDSTADQMASAAANPEQSAEDGPQREAAVESGEDQLASVLAKVRETLGLASNEIKIEHAFSMTVEGHHLYFQAKRPEIPRVEMATARRDYLDFIVRRAIREEKEGKKRPDLLAPLEEIAAELEKINFDWEANTGKSQEEAQVRMNYVHTLERIAIVLNTIGAEFKLKDLENLGHPSKYAQVEAVGGRPKLLPEWRGSSKIRPKFYGSYRDSTYDWKDKRLAKLVVGAPAGQFFDEMTGKPEPINVPNLKTNVTIDHVSPKVVDHWNDVGHNAIQGTRLDFYNETSNMRLVSHKNNSTDGALTTSEYQDEVGISFRGPDDNP
ncbi:MAG TPA: hypothetical protein VF297_26835 [Pyrinomonadaceae bacterium]